MNHVDDLISTLAKKRYEEFELSRDIQHLEQEMRSHECVTDECMTLRLRDECKQLRQENNKIVSTSTKLCEENAELRRILRDESEERKKEVAELKALLGRRV
jgi:ribosomal protein L16 Arg81 hydroxylase